MILRRYVVDASAAAEYLLRTELGLQLGEIMDGASLMAPELLDVEVVSVFRRAVLHRHLEEARAAQALDDLVAWPLDRIAHGELVKEAWRHRYNLSAYDAFYVAAAQRFEVPLLTVDGPLSRAPGLGIVVHNIQRA